MKRILSLICTCFILIGSAAAQEQMQVSRDYIFCNVDFIRINSRTEIRVDFGQLEKKIFPETVNDKRLMGGFNSEIAAINWMSRNGWELYMYSPYMDEGDSNVRYIMRMDVTGMTEEQINSKLTMFVMPTDDVLPPQNIDGSFPAIKAPSSADDAR